MQINSDEGFSFDENDYDGEKNQADTTNNGDSDSQLTPSYLLSGILAGLYYLPPEFLLRNQIGWGRRVTYNSFNAISLAWKPTHVNDDTLLSNIAQFSSFRYAEIVRHFTCHKTKKHLIGSFRVYSVQLREEVRGEWNKHLEDMALRDASISDNNISVSNAGGYHSKPRLFNNNEDTIIQDFADVVAAALQVVETHDHAQSAQESHHEHQSSCAHDNAIQDDGDANATSSSKIRELQSPEEAEAWLNVSSHGNWNRLHTHESATWSGVYYVHSDSTTHDPDRPYSGQFVFKPTPHHSEEEYILSDTERRRLNPCVCPCCSTAHHDCDDISDGCNREVVADYACDKDADTDNTFPTTDKNLTEEETQQQDGSRSREKKRTAVCATHDPTVCDYALLPPEEGTLFIMPSYLHHAVLPLAVQKESRQAREGQRISLAFNFNEKSNY